MNKRFVGLGILFSLIFSWLASLNTAFGAVDDIARLYNFTPGTTISSSQVNAEFNQLITTINNKFGRGVANTITGANTFTGNNTFTGDNTLSGNDKFTGTPHFYAGSRQGYVKATVSSIDTSTDTITTSAAHGVATADVIRIRVLTGGTIPGGLNANHQYYGRAVTATTLTLHPTASDANGNTNKVDITSSGSGTIQIIADNSSPVEGDFWFNNGLKIRKAGASNIVADNVDIRGYCRGLVPTYVTANTITLSPGQCRDSTNTYTLTSGGTLTLDNSTTGALGRLDGPDGANQWQYVYIIGKSSDGTVSAGLSTVNEAVSGSITLPTGYDLKRQLPFAVRNDGSSNFIPFFVAEGWPTRPVIRYNVTTNAITGTVGPTNVLDAGSAVSFSALSLASYVPPISSAAYLKLGLFNNSSTASTLAIRKYGSSHSGDQFLANSSAPFFDYPWYLIETDSSQLIEWRWTVNTGVQEADIAVMGFVVTGVN